MRARIACCLAVFATALFSAATTLAQCPSPVPAQGAALPAPLPLFPADNWWNLDISAAPVDPGSAAYIAFINNGGTRRLHPDFGGEASPGSVDVYGMPYAVVDGTQPKLAVTFQYADESDGVDTRRQSVPFYPIPAQAITQPHWIEGGAPGNVDQRDDERSPPAASSTARNRYLYELYNVFYDAAQAQWHAGSGAFFDLNTNDRRPDTLDLGGRGGPRDPARARALRRGVESAVADIGHAFRVTVRATNGYVYPASHRAGSTAGALPMGARLRLKERGRPGSRAAHVRPQRAARSSARCRRTASSSPTTAPTCTSPARSTRAGTTTS